MKRNEPIKIFLFHHKRSEEHSLKVNGGSQLWLLNIICLACFQVTNVYCTACNPDESLVRPVLYMAAREEHDKEVLQQKTPNKLDDKKICPFCRMNNEHDDKKNFVLARFKHFMVALNLYPYSRGHLLILPYAHVNNITALSPESSQELISLISECVKIVQMVVKADGINVGINIGSTAGASVTDHLHIHIVPRYTIEPRTFLTCIAEARVIQWNLNTLYGEFYQEFQNSIKRYEK